MSLNEWTTARDFTSRMQQGRDAARERRNRSGGGGGKLVSSAALNASFAAAYQDDRSRAEYADHYADECDRGRAEFEALNAAEIERFGCDLAGNRWEPEVPGGLPSPGRVALARPGPARAPGEHRQRKETSMADTDDEMTPEEFVEAIETLWESVYAAAPDLRMSYRQLRRMAAGEAAVHPALALLLRLMLHKRIKPHELG